ncbi:Quinol monooxygenase YgiN [Quadrisphaera granulorum]|uniref:Quinol monooxygenase YgiN n=1 Tax=Quadrisphaera granulorum TaxID=317664 RepID=A0A315ZTT8_9ACTN|nr:antibiotic biosynthesis monooxygenase [Quadrisphaera granulorum]PWJ48320.1 quinol monooxygenase YgiN [Quadrisphaera granulorum]SZE98481.1 Quinol monooxygenase YgiN [Quadrisphaera granulorum]
MIIRVSEASVRPDRVEDFMIRLHELVAGFPEAHPGLLRHEVLVDLEDPTRVQYVSWWRDEGSLVRYAGPHWRHEPVTFPDEALLLQAPLTLRHFLADKE